MSTESTATTTTTKKPRKERIVIDPVKFVRCCKKHNSDINKVAKELKATPNTVRTKMKAAIAAGIKIPLMRAKIVQFRTVKDELNEMLEKMDSPED